jgi:glycosyltransferase involved in cell wall biosynthesis
MLPRANDATIRAVDARAVSVVIPVRNRAALVGGAIASVLAQTAPPHEVIVVDDGSTDATPDVLASFGDAVRVVRHARSRERGAARHAGAAAAGGRLLAFLDSDDEWEPDTLARQLGIAALRGSAAVAAVTGIRTIDGRGRVRGRPYAPPPDAHERLPWRNTYHGGPSSLLIGADLFDRIGGFPEERAVQGSEDWLLMMKLRAAGVRPAVLPAPLVRYRAHVGSSTGDPDLVAGCIWSAITWMERAELLSGSDARTVRARNAALIARRYANAGRWRAAARWSGKGVRSGAVTEFAARMPVIVASGVRGALRRRGL